MAAVPPDPVNRAETWAQAALAQAVPEARVVRAEDLVVGPVAILNPAAP